MDASLAWLAFRCHLNHPSERRDTRSRCLEGFGRGYWLGLVKVFERGRVGCEFLMLQVGCLGGEAHRGEKGGWGGSALGLGACSSLLAAL